MTDLLFDAPLPASPNLVFGADGGVTPAQISATLVGVLPGPILLAEVRAVTEVAMAGSLPSMQMTATASYSSNTSRPTAAQSVGAWQHASSTGVAGVAHGQQGTLAQPVGWVPPWQQANKVQPVVHHPLPKVLAPTPIVEAARHQQGVRTQSTSEFRQQEAARSVRKLLAGAFEQAALVRGSTSFHHQDGDHSKRQNKSAKWRDTLNLHRPWRSDFQPATTRAQGLFARHQDAISPPPGMYVPPPPPPPPACYEAEPWLVFQDPIALSGNLRFKCDYDSSDVTETIIVPIQRVYIVINNVSLHRVSDNAIVPAFSMSLSLDFTSWTWGFDAIVSAQYQALVEPTSGPVELIAGVNGSTFRVMVEQISRERSFGSQTLRIAGRGRNAFLDAPYAPVIGFTNEIERTANQLAEDALLYNGVNVDGWSVQWGLTDWMIPAGVFTHHGTHISALNAIAQSAGGYLQPHRTDKVLRVLPRYPVAPWKWATDVVPNFELPASVTLRESIQWVEKPSYNRVFVSGQNSGIVGQVSIAGTAGDTVAPMVVDSLITGIEAARQRGIAVLGDTGKIATVGLSLPVLDTIGVIEPGKFVRYVDGGVSRLGLVRSTQVSINGVDTQQQLVLETHE